MSVKIYNTVSWDLSGMYVTYMITYSVKIAREDKWINMIADLYFQ